MTIGRGSAMIVCTIYIVLCIGIIYLHWAYPKETKQNKTQPTPESCIQTETAYWKEGNHLHPILICKEKLCQ